MFLLSYLANGELFIFTAYGEKFIGLNILGYLELNPLILLIPLIWDCPKDMRELPGFFVNVTYSVLGGLDGFLE